MEQESLVTDEMKDVAAKQLKEQAEARKSGVRFFQREGSRPKVYVSDLFEFPKNFDLSNLAPTSYLAQPEGEITGSVDTQAFSVIEERLKGLVFDNRPGRTLNRQRRLRVVKALTPTGTLVQLPFEDQHNNAIAGSMEDALGLRYYQRKGFLLFYNFETGLPVYCFALDCFAPAMIPELASQFPDHTAAIDTGYCSLAHKGFTQPNTLRRGMFQQDATTSKVYHGGPRPEDGASVIQGR